MSLSLPPSLWFISQFNNRKTNAKSAPSIWNCFISRLARALSSSKTVHSHLSMLSTLHTLCCQRPTRRGRWTDTEKRGGEQCMFCCGLLQLLKHFLPSLTKNGDSEKESAESKVNGKRGKCWNPFAMWLVKDPWEGHRASPGPNQVRDESFAVSCRE